MIPAKGYYCLIQYCPDRTRLEAATIGVLLFCPEKDFLKAHTAKDNRRIQRFFGRNGHDWTRINSFKTAIEERLEVERPEIKSLVDLETFIALRANQFVITPPRTMRVVDPEEDLKRLFDEVVGAPHRKQHTASFQRYVGSRFSKAGLLQRKIRTNIEVLVPVFNKQVAVPYGFQNERFHLIQPVRFQASSSDQAMNTACRYAVEGRSLWDNQDPDLGKLKLVVVGKFLSQHRETKVNVRRVLEDSNVELFSVNELDRLINEIRTTGKDLPINPAAATANSTS
jgi:hypothetical protein